MGNLSWIEVLLDQGFCDTLDLRVIRRLEGIYLKKIRFIRLESGRVVSIPEIFRRCGWWSE